jgi:N-acyl-D-amino-acid deacylase
VAPAFADLPMTGKYVSELQAVDTLLQNFMAGKPIPGGTITITQHDKVIYDRGIGYSNAANTAPMQETALMRLASVSKPITASAIQQLAKDGQLDLNAKVFNINGNGGILDITPYNGTLGDSRLRDITVQHLLEHQGGWNRDTVGDLAFRDVQIANAIGVPSPPGILNSARYILSRPLQFTPGTDYNYSNIGYMFLGMVVEDVSGQPYETYVDNNVLAPAGIPAWEVDAGRTFAADQNPREPFYSTQFTSAQNVYDPTGPRVSAPYGGWDHEKFLALGGLIASSKAIAMFAQNRILDGPEVGKLRSDYTTSSEYVWWKDGSLEGTDSLVVQGTGNDTTYSILFDRRPSDGSSYSFSLALLLESTLQGISSWPAELVYAGDFTSDQWLTFEDITLFTHALALGSEAAFTTAYPSARYSAGDFDDNGLVNSLDATGLIGALQHAGVPEEYIALVPELPGDFNRDGIVDAADYVVWRKAYGISMNLPNETLSLGIVDQADYDVWSSNLGTSLGSGSGAALSAKVPEPSALLLVAISLAGVACCYTVRRRSIPALQLILAIVPLVAFAAGVQADIYQWEYINPADPTQGKRQSMALAPEGAGVDAVPGAYLSPRNLTMAYLVGADLTGAYGYYLILTDANLSQANLTDAYLQAATLTDADFSEAEIRGAYFGRRPPCVSIFGCGEWGSGISVAQLYSTASYQAHDLSGVNFDYNYLAGSNLAGQNLTNASFIDTNLAGADLTAADLRGALLNCAPCIARIVATNLIQLNGHIRGLDLAGGKLLVVRDYDGNSKDFYGNPVLPIPIPITVNQHLTMGPGGTLRMVFEADTWDSTISFAPGIPVKRGGTLELTFAADVNPATQLGRTFDLFDWTGVTPTGGFAISSPYRWDSSNLYTTGEVTLTAVPEPSGLLQLSCVLAATLAIRRANALHRRRPRRE